MICLMLTGALLAQPPQNDQGPRLTPVVSDEFRSDTRSDYRVKGDVSWEPERLRLADGASLSRDINGQAWARIRLRIDPSELSARQPEWQFKVRLHLNERPDCYVRLGQRLNGRQIVGSLAIVDTGEEDGALQEYTLREWSPNSFGSGDISIEYQYEVVRIVLPDGKVFAGFVANTHDVHAVTFENIAADLDIVSLNISAEQPGHTQEQNRSLPRHAATRERW